MCCWRVRFSPVVKFRRSHILFVVLALLAAGAAWRPITSLAGTAKSAREKPSAVGGYGMIVADYLWLETNLAWEIRDVPKVRQLINFTVKSDPQTPYFWLNGARMMAYDFPAWQCEESSLAPLAVQANWRMRGADEALLLLERGQRWHGKSAVLHLEMANICLYGLGDRHRAAEYYRSAAEQSDAPDYAARIYARLHDEEIAGMTLTR